MFIIRSKRLVFADFDGGDLGGGDAEIPEEAVVDSGTAVVGNPAWDEIKTLIDEDAYNRIAPKLAEWDTGTQKRLETLSGKYKPYEPIIEGRDPQYLDRAIKYADWLDKSPDEVYAKLGDYLKSVGKLPNGQPDLGQKVDQDVDADTGIVDPRIAQLEEQQQKITQMIQQQHEAALRSQAESQLNAEIGDLKKAHADLDDDDVQEVIMRAALIAQRNQGRPGAKIPTLEEAYQEYASVQNRILTKARPGDSAPSLVPPSGGGASGQQQKPWGELTKGETEDAVAALLKGMVGS